MFNLNCSGSAVNDSRKHSTIRYRLFCGGGGVKCDERVEPVLRLRSFRFISCFIIYYACMFYSTVFLIVQFQLTHHYFISKFRTQPPSITLYLKLYVLCLLCALFSFILTVSMRRTNRRSNWHSKR